MSADVLTDLTYLFLGSRIKRLAERMQADVVRVGEQVGLAIQPSQYPLLATLDRDGPQTIGALSEAMQLSQPAITRTAARLIDMGLIEEVAGGRDQRLKTVMLSAAGIDAMVRAKRELWPQIEAAVREMLRDLPTGFPQALSAIEARLAHRSLRRRAADQAARGLAIREFDSGTAHQAV